MDTAIAPPTPTSGALKLSGTLGTAPEPEVDAVDARHRAACRMCTPEPQTAEEYIESLYRAHVPGYSARPRLRSLLRNGGARR